MAHLNRRRWIARLAILSGLGGSATLLALRNLFLPKRVRVLIPGRLIRGAWQRPTVLRRLIRRERIRSIVTLTAINQSDPKYIGQSSVVRSTHVQWVIVPMRGSTATLDQLAEAADWLADPANQPVFFHCVAGHHRTNLTHAAFRIRHQGWSAQQAWNELLTLPWTHPVRDLDDYALLKAFASSHQHLPTQISAEAQTL